MKALQIAATGMAAQQMKVDVVSNNLANMSTTGYNPRRADFADLTYQQMARPGSVSAADGSMLPTGIQIVGRTYCDADVFQAAMAYEAAQGQWYRSSAERPKL